MELDTRNTGSSDETSHLPPMQPTDGPESEVVPALHGLPADRRSETE